MKKLYKQIATLLFATTIFNFSLFIGFAQQPVITPNIGHINTPFLLSDAIFSPDGKHILSYRGGDVKLWDIETMRVVKNYNLSFTEINGISFSPNGETFAVYYNKLVIINTLTGEILDIIPEICPTIAKNIAYTPDGNYLIWTCAPMSLNTFVYLYHIATKVTSSFNVHFEPQISMRLTTTPDSKQIIFTDNKYADLYYWSIEKDTLVKTIPLYAGEISAQAFSNDQKLILNAANDTSVQLFDLVSGTKIRNYRITKEIVIDLKFSNNGKFFYVTSCIGEQVMVDIESGQIIKEYKKYDFALNFYNNISTDDKYFLRATNVELIMSDVLTAEIVKLFPYKNSEVSETNITTDGNFIFSLLDHSYPRIWDFYNPGMFVSLSFDTAKFIPINFFGLHKPVSYTTDYKYVILLGKDSVSASIWNVGTDKEQFQFKTNFKIEQIKCSPNNNYSAIYSTEPVKLYMFDNKTGQIKWSKSMDDLTEIHQIMSFTPDGKYIVTGAYLTTPRIFSVENGIEITLNTDKVNTAFSNNNNFIISSAGNKLLTYQDYANFIWDIATGRLLKKLLNDYDFPVSFTPDSKGVLTYDAYESQITIHDILTDKKIKTITDPIKYYNAAQIQKPAITPDNKYIYYIYNNTIRFYDIAKDTFRSFEGHNGIIKNIVYKPGSKFVLSDSDDGSIRIWDINTGKEIFRMYAHYKTNDWLVITPDGYWDGSKKCGEMVSMVDGYKLYTIDQFALSRNRPDILLQRIGSNDSSLMKHYYKQFLKRLRKSGFTEEQLSADYHVPETRIIKKSVLDKNLILDFELNDSQYKLKNYNIYINDVPIFGSFGKSISGNNLQINETIELQQGTNKIEISCLNEKGSESFRAFTFENYNKPVLPNLYYIGFGVSKYENPEFNLGYAHKDALDLEQTFLNMKGKGFTEVFTKTYINEQVTPSTIKAAKEFLKNAKPDDVFVLFIAGHGMHDTDAEATYYFLTHNTELNNLAGTAANFEFIEDLLQGIAPRNKLFLMDACESGEIDDEQTVNYLANTESRGLKSRGFVKVETQTTFAKRNFLHQKDRYIYNDLMRRSGAIVFSSSKGGELSYEFSNLENGLFTEYIMKALSGEADADKNGIVSTDELRTYVSAEVSKASGGAQNPTVDRDNIFQKFGFGGK
ncbi:MAG TPA: hypothetical protein DCQ31_18895 [Bacteroidales bacterium]|nr:hypothetical protein [Bacteroidales bacterium]